MTHHWHLLLAELQAAGHSRRSLAIRHGLSKDRLYLIAKHGHEPTYHEGEAILEEHKKYCRSSAIEHTAVPETVI